MIEKPLPRVDTRDPRSTLSDAARRRLSNAHADADLIRARALAHLETRYRSEPHSDDCFSEFLSKGQPSVDFADAKMQSARAVLSVVKHEF